MEVDKIYHALFSHGRKKRYAGKVAWPTDGEIIVRGYEIRRTDAFDLQSEAQMQVLEKILGNDVDGAIELAKSLVAEIRDGKQRFSTNPQDAIEGLVISRTVKDYVTKDMLSNQEWLGEEKPSKDEQDRRRKQGRYLRPSSLTNVNAAEKLVRMGEYFVPGMKVSWVVTDHTKSPMEVEPYLSGRLFGKEPDWEYYARRVAQTLAYVTEVYGWDEKALLTGAQPAQQKSLFSEEFDAERSQARALRKAEKKLTL